jgi:hypothetical protein
MNDEELRRLWRLGSEEDRATRERIAGVAGRAAKLDRVLLRRDRVEVLAGVLVIVVALGVSLAAPGWTPKLGAAVLAAGVTYTLRRLVAASQRHRHMPDDLPVAARVRRELDRVQEQIELLRSVRSWYLVPISVGGMAWMLAIVSAAPLRPGLLPALLAVSGVAGLSLFGVVGWAIERLNRKAARNLEPYRADLEALLDDLEGA